MCANASSSNAIARPDSRKGRAARQLDDSEAKAALKELEARPKLAQENLSRLTMLVERHAASQQALDQARADVAQLEALIAGQKAKLDNYVLRAPSAGVVLRQDAEVGEIAEPARCCSGSASRSRFWWSRMLTRRIFRASISASACCSGRTLFRQGARRQGRQHHAERRSCNQDLPGPHRPAERHAAPHRHVDRCQHRHQGGEECASGSDARLARR